MAAAKEDIMEYWRVMEKGPEAGSWELLQETHRSGRLGNRMVSHHPGTPMVMPFLCLSLAAPVVVAVPFGMLEEEEEEGQSL